MEIRLDYDARPEIRRDPQRRRTILRVRFDVSIPRRAAQLHGDRSVLRVQLGSSRSAIERDRAIRRLDIESAARFLERDRSIQRVRGHGAVDLTQRDRTVVRFEIERRTTRRTHDVVDQPVATGRSIGQDFVSTDARADLTEILLECCRLAGSHFVTAGSRSDDIDSTVLRRANGQRPRIADGHHLLCAQRGPIVHGDAQGAAIVQEAVVID